MSLNMMRAIAHRGPDDHGSWNNGRLAFGHQRLSIIDLSQNGRQPMLAASGDGVLVYNGEVYNFGIAAGLIAGGGACFPYGLRH